MKWWCGVLYKENPLRGQQEEEWEGEVQKFPVRVIEPLGCFGIVSHVRI